METTIIVPPEYLYVLKLFAADETDDRKHLRGICVEIGPAESRLIATNGVMLGVFRVASGAPLLTAPVSVILPNYLLAQLKGKGDIAISVGELAEGANGRAIRLSQRDEVFRGVSIDGVYPFWRRVIPSSTNEGAGMYDFKALALLAKAYALLHGSKGPCLAAIAQHGADSGLIDLRHPDFTGAVMPLRSPPVPLPSKTSPVWAADMLTVENVADLV